MFRVDPAKTIKCPKCGYLCSKPFPDFCPKCSTSLRIELQKYDEAHGMELQKKKLLAQAEQKPSSSSAPAAQESVKQFEPSKTKASHKIRGVRVKKKKTIKFDLSQPVVELGSPGEYFKLIGIVHENRVPLYCSNEQYHYFLELSCNLDDIATSILGGDLDQMNLVGEDNVSSDSCVFSVHDGIIYILLGEFSGKKGNWLLTQLRRHMADHLACRDPTALSKIELHTLQKKFDGIVTSLLAQYVKLSEVFSKREIPALEETARVDYFGLSYRTIGVISRLYGTELEVANVGDVDDPAIQQELKESRITAKLEAIAANTLANTSCIPRWIAVKLGFESYRWIVFVKLQNEYFYQILCEGNIQKILALEDQIGAFLQESIQKPFKGDLARFAGEVKQLDAFFAAREF